MHDLAVAYRIYPGVSGPSRGLPFDQDKLHQAELCVRSFRRATSSLKVKLWAIMDSCPVEYEQMFRRYFQPEDLVLINLQKAGNYGTFAKQVSILIEQNDAECVFFAEDDYLYTDRDFSSLVRFLQHGGDVDFISPFDHTDDYTLELHNFPKLVRVYEGQHWRNAASTCLTFLTTKRTLQRFRNVFLSYSRGNFDVGVWLALTKYRLFNPFHRFLYNPQGKYFMMRSFLKAWRYSAGQILFGKRARLWVPMPSFALHLDRFHVAPGYDLADAMLEEDRLGSASQEFSPEFSLTKSSVVASS
jgi:hypothetical protein